MNAPASSNSVRVRRHVPAPPAKVFAAWTDPDKLRLWSAPDGVDVRRADVDLRVGGRYRIHMRDPEGREFTASGIYRTIEPPELLVYTWDWEESDHAVGETVITVRFRAAGEGTEVELTHEGFSTPAQASGHDEGWQRLLRRLERVAGDGSI